MRHPRWIEMRRKLNTRFPFNYVIDVLIGTSVILSPLTENMLIAAEKGKGDGKHHAAGGGGGGGGHHTGGGGGGGHHSSGGGGGGGHHHAGGGGGGGGHHAGGGGGGHRAGGGGGGGGHHAGGGGGGGVHHAGGTGGVTRGIGGGGQPSTAHGRGAGHIFGGRSSGVMRSSGDVGRRLGSGSAGIMRSRREVGRHFGRNGMGTIQQDRGGSALNRALRTRGQIRDQIGGQTWGPLRGQERFPINRISSMTRAQRQTLPLGDREKVRSIVERLNRSAGTRPGSGRDGRRRDASQAPAARSFSGNWQQRLQSHRSRGDQLRRRVQRDHQEDVRNGVRHGRSWWHEGRHAVASDWRRHANWKALKLWLGWAYTPLYYEDGLSYYVPETMLTSPLYFSDYAYQDLVPAQIGDWLPLGLFVITSGSASDISPNWYLELAVNAAGDLGGYFYNSALDTSQEVVGDIDPNTQEAAWVIKDQIDSPVFSTGAYNLTQEETTVQMTFPEGKKTTLLVTRLDRTAL